MIHQLVQVTRLPQEADESYVLWCACGQEFDHTVTFGPWQERQIITVPELFRQHIFTENRTPPPSGPPSFAAEIDRIHADYKRELERWRAVVETARDWDQHSEIDEPWTHDREQCAFGMALHEAVAALASAKAEAKR